ncbi:hypothetical protein STEG23_010130 [Scotinomys teguina]
MALEQKLKAYFQTHKLEKESPLRMAPDVVWLHCQKSGVHGYVVEYCSFEVCEELCWDFHGDCIESVDCFWYVPCIPDFFRTSFYSFFCPAS